MQDPARRGSGPRVCPVASAPAVPAMCRRVGSMPGDGGSTRVRSTISRPVRARRRHRLTPTEVRAIEDMVTSPEYRHVPTGTLAVLAQRLGKVWASPSTWYRLVRQYGWRRPRLRVHPAKPKMGLRTTRAERDVAHRHHRHPPARRDPRLSARRDRQLLATDLGVASRRHVRAGQQRGRAARRQSGRDALRRRPRSCWRMRASRT